MTEIDRYGHPVERVRPDRPTPLPTLTADEIKKVVDLVVAYTGREPDKTMIEVWATQSALGRWTFPEAARAIHLWGRDRSPNAFLEPSDVTRTIRAERQDRALREENERLRQPGDPVAAERVQQYVTEIASKMGWDADGEPMNRGGFALKVRCPHCGVSPGARCVTPSTGSTLTKQPCHPSRADALAEHLRGTA